MNQQQRQQAYKLHNLETGPSTQADVTKDNALKYYKQMQTIRRLETAAGNLYKEKIVRGFCHLYSGQEACAVGMSSNINMNDSCIPSHKIDNKIMNTMACKTFILRAIEQWRAVLYSQ